MVLYLWLTVIEKESPSRVTPEGAFAAARISRSYVTRGTRTMIAAMAATGSISTPDPTEAV